MAGLTVTKLQSLKPSAKLYRVADSLGLSIEVKTNGLKYWRYRYRFGGTPKMLSFGAYPEISLAEARQARDEARALLRKHIDPSLQRQQVRQALATASGNTFEGIGREWLEKRKSKLAQSTYDKIVWMLEELAFPWIGSRPISTLDPPTMLTMLKRVEARGKHETAQRLKQYCSQVFRHAIGTGRATSDPCRDLRGQLETPKVTHRAAITDAGELAHLIRDIRSYSGTLTTATALQLAPLLFVRPGELRQAEWTEINLETATWTIPAAKMKMRKEHLVLLPDQAVALLKDLHPLTGAGKFVFPGVRTRQRPLSENTLNAALRRLGYGKEHVTAHGFRATARSLLAEQGWAPEIIERHLAHKASGPLGEAYDRARYLPERRKMLQAWADYLDRLHDGSNCIAGNLDKAA
jgi:integrase